MAINCWWLNKMINNGGSGSEKRNSLSNIINHQPVIEKIKWYAKDLYDAKYQLLINKREGTGLK